LAERAVVEATEAADAASVAEQSLEDTVRRLETELAEARQRLVEARRQSYRAESRRRRVTGELSRLSE
jgi:predicted  nucleic acid-binding Zn-ribbon protein